MPDKTLIEEAMLVRACEITGTCELYRNYQYNGADPNATCVAFTCSDWKNATQFFIELATQDATLATNMLDDARRDDLGYDDVVYFPSYDLEEAE